MQPVPAPVWFITQRTLCAMPSVMAFSISASVTRMQWQTVRDAVTGGRSAIDIGEFQWRERDHGGRNSCSAVTGQFPFRPPSCPSETGGHRNRPVAPSAVAPVHPRGGSGFRTVSTGFRASGGQLPCRQVWSRVNLRPAVRQQLCRTALSLRTVSADVLCSEIRFSASGCRSPAHSQSQL